jgi:hypothetical protein
MDIVMFLTFPLPFKLPSSDLIASEGSFLDLVSVFACGRRMFDLMKTGVCLQPKRRDHVKAVTDKR